MADNKPKVSLMDLEDLNKQESSGPSQATTPSVETEEEDDVKISRIRKFGEEGGWRGFRETKLQGLSEQLLPPITKRKIARYQVLGMDKIDPLTNEIPGVIAPVIIPSTIVVEDPFDQDPLKRYKVLRYITRSEPRNISGKMDIVETLGEISFSDGYLSVNVERDYLLYCVMELHPLNESNKRRPKSEVAPAFKRMDIDRRNWANNVAVMDLAHEAEAAIIKMRNQDDIIAVATALGVHTRGRIIEGDGGIKHDMRIFARRNPIDFFKVVKNNEASTRLAVIDAANFGLIEYSVDKKAWFFSTDGQKIGTHLVGEDPTDALVKLLGKPEYKEKYAKLSDQLNYWD
jgi:hypothetical protein